jgi:hypothetical protein
MASICRDALLLAAAGVLVAWLRVSLQAIAARGLLARRSADR